MTQDERLGYLTASIEALKTTLEDTRDTMDRGFSAIGSKLDTLADNIREVETTSRDDLRRVQMALEQADQALDHKINKAHSRLDELIQAPAKKALEINRSIMKRIQDVAIGVLVTGALLFIGSMILKQLTTK